MNQLENDLLQVELSLGELQYRLQCLRNQNEQSLQQRQEAGNACDQQLEQLKNDWEIREQKLVLKRDDLRMLHLAEVQGSQKTNKLFGIIRNHLGPGPTLYQYD